MHIIYPQYKKLLSELIAIKSISTDISFKDEMKKTANWYIDFLRGYGFEVDVLQGEISNPVIVAKYIVEKEAPTVLLYGHYDVQPADQDGWLSDPFILDERDGRLYGRGVVDNKGQLLIHIAAIIHLIEKGELQKNITFLIEGNEETSNPELAVLVAKHIDLLKADIVMVSDGELCGEHPVIETSLRGGTNIKVTYKTAHTDAHSGIYGGAIPNAAHELSKMINTLFDHEYGNVAVEGFYDDCYSLDKIEKLNSDTIETYLIDQGHKQMHHVGAKKIVTEKIVGTKNVNSADGADNSVSYLDHAQLPFHVQTGARPTLQVTGISSGYIGAGYANIVPYLAEARINVRTVAPQSTEKVVSHILNHIHKHTPEHVEIQIESTEHNDPFSFSCDGEELNKVKEILTKAFEKEVIIVRVGGGIPIVSDLSKLIGGEVMLIPLGNDDCNMHGANENARVDIIEKGLEFSSQYFGHK